MNKDIKRLYRSRDHRIIAGVCGGIAEYFEIDPTITRILFLILGFGMGSGILIYIIMALVVPLEPVGGGSTDEASVDRLTERAKETVEKVAGKMEDALAGRHEHRHKDGFRSVFGFALVLIGLVTFFGIFMPFPHMAWRMIWPIVLVVLGFFIISKN